MGQGDNLLITVMRLMQEIARVERMGSTKHQKEAPCLDGECGNLRRMYLNGGQKDKEEQALWGGR